MTTTGQEIVLMDGTKFTASPLKISLLKPFMKTFTGLEKVADDNDKSMDVMMDCVAIAMKQYAPDLALDRVKMEDLLDLPSVYKVIEAASGVKFDDSGNAQSLTA